MDWRSLRDSIPALRGQVYLNTGVSGPPPSFAIQEEIDWTRRLAESGPGRADIFGSTFEEVDRVRTTVADLLGAEADEIALTQSCSNGIALVAAGMRWERGDEVIVSDVEHISGLLPWYHLQRKYGVVVREVPVTEGRWLVDDVARALSPRTRLICMSHVAYNTGARLPVADVASLAREHDVLLLVDGAQGPGHMDVDVKQLGCHVYACAGQKWLLGPDGTGAVYVDYDAVDAIDVSHLGWASVQHDGGTPEQYTLQPGARRYEVAGKHVPSLAALRRSVGALQAVGLRTIEKRILHLVGVLRDGLARVPGLDILTPAPRDLWSGLVVFRLAGADAEEVVDTLWERHRIVIRWVPSPRALRASVHAFNTEEELQRLVDALAELPR